MHLSNCPTGFGGASGHILALVHQAAGGCDSSDPSDVWEF